MTNSDHTTPTKPRPAAAQAYLDELASSLKGVDRAEGDEVLTSIREHIDEQLAELGQQPTPTDVNTILDGLGSVDKVLATLDYQPLGQPEGDALAGWPVWMPRMAVAVGWISLVFLLFNPFVAVPLAVLAVVTGFIGIRRYDTQRRVYAIALALGGLTLVGTLIAAVLFLGASDGPIIVNQSPVPISSP